MIYDPVKSDLELINAPLQLERELWVNIASEGGVEVGCTERKLVSQLYQQ